MFKKIVFWGLMISCIMGLTVAGPAQAAIIPNGDFETGDLTHWVAFGLAGVDCAAPWIINGNCDGWIHTNGVNGVCSWLVQQNLLYPTYVPKAVSVSFKVRYNTDQGVWWGNPWDDPFHAVLFRVNEADYTMVTIGTGQVTPSSGFAVTRLDTNTTLQPPTRPTFTPNPYGWDWWTPVYLVSGTIPHNTCDPVYIRFDICNALDALSDSLAEVDDVNITFVNATGATGTWWKTPGGPVPCP